MTGAPLAECRIAPGPMPCWFVVKIPGAEEDSAMVTGALVMPFKLTVTFAEVRNSNSNGI